MKKTTFEDLADLKPNWDGYGALAIKPEAIKMAELILGRRSIKRFSEPSLVPLCDGGIQLEWHSDLEAEISIDGDLNLFFCCEFNGKRELASKFLRFCDDLCFIYEKEDNGD